MYVYSTVDEYLHSFKEPKSTSFACLGPSKISLVVILIPLTWMKSLP
jgi:hypothetical protein